jgi:adenylate cyclase
MGGYALGFLERDPATGLEYVRRALALNPSAARAHDFAGWLQLYQARPEAARDHFDRALELCPLDEFSFRMLTGRAFANLFLRHFEAAAADGRRAHAAAVHYTVCHRVLAAALAHLGRDKDAKAVVRELRTVHPGLTLARFARETRFEGPECRRILFDGLLRAGLP